MNKQKELNRQRQRRCFRVRNKLKRVSHRPRLSVFRSHKHIYAQVIDDTTGRTLAAASTLEKEILGDRKHGGDIEAAKLVGRAIAERALAAGIKQVVFDRGPYKYHGRVAALADAARDAGLDIGPKKVIEEEGAEKAPAKEKKTKVEKALQKMAAAQSAQKKGGKK